MNAAMIIHLFPGFMSMIAVYYIIKMLGWSDGPMLRVAMIQLTDAMINVFHTILGKLNTEKSVNNFI